MTDQKVYVVPLEATRRQQLDRQLQMDKYDHLKRLTSVIDQSIDALIDFARAHPLLMPSRLVFGGNLDENELWHHVRVLGPMNTDKELNEWYLIRLPDGKLTRVVSTDSPHTVLVILEELTISEIGLLMSSMSTLDNTR